MQQSEPGSATRWPSYGAVQGQCNEKDESGAPASLTEGNRCVRAFEVARSAPSNEIHTSKYTWYTFVPLNLYEQFHCLANVYFLFIALLQTIPSISITSGQPLLLMPLSFVLAVGAARDLFEDEKRKAADRAENERELTRVRDATGSHMTVQWRDVRPGHVLRLRRGEMVPADALLLGSSEASGGCAVETSNLDGETDHKPKVSALATGRSLEAIQAYQLEFEPPGADLYEFKGALLTEGDAPLGVGVNSLLLRGSTLWQAEWVDCLVCYCGHDTRVMRNLQKPCFKASWLDAEMNGVILVIFVVQLLLCAVGGTSYAVWESTYYADSWYLEPNPSEGELGLALGVLKKAATWLLQLNNMVPISLMVMMTTVKFLQGKFLQLDEACYDAQRQKHAEVHTSQVLESLGQVTHVFSDKTGTLTCNQMVYKACAVAGGSYGGAGAALAPPSPPSPSGSGSGLHVDFAAGRAAFLRAAGEAVAAADRERQALMGNFLLCHGLCHTVTVQNDKEGRDSSSDSSLGYAASSPDELALVWAARELGLTLAGQAQSTVSLQVSEPQLTAPLAAACGSDGKGVCPWNLQVDILELCEFDNDRKRMSVVARYPDGRRVLLMKGADSAVLPHLGSEDERRQAAAQLDGFACSGLRTLCLAYRELPEAEHGAWSGAYRAALAAVSGDRAERVQRLACELETGAGLRLLGVTAIEDRLQEGVPETLEYMISAGITVWVLTGDKMETAISIGKSCRLLTADVDNLEVTGGRDEVLKVLQEAEQGMASSGARAITITGTALAAVLADEDLRCRFYRVARHCQTVICCRVSPKQKADVVDIVKDFHRVETGDQPITLAIGDGANDVSMITVAHVGVGLSGKEGAQAARSADFAIGQFRFLRRLIFVHGRESYRRNSVLVCYNFYKNMVLVLPPFLFGPFMAFSGQPFYEQVLYQLYNVAFTFWPCVFFAILDRPVHNLRELEEDVRWYLPGLKKQFFNVKVFLLWIGAAILQGAFLPVAGFMVHRSATDHLWLTGTGVFFWVVLCVNLALLRRLTLAIPATVAVIAGSVLCFPAFVLALDLLGSPHLHGITLPLFGVGSLQFALATWFAVVVFLALGEPLITLATPGGPPPAQPEPVKSLPSSGCSGDPWVSAYVRAPV